jgi:hypothetical protein
MAEEPRLVAPSCPTHLLSGLGPDSFLAIAQKQYRLRPDTRTQSVAARKGGLWGGAPTEIYKEISCFFNVFSSFFLIHFCGNCASHTGRLEEYALAPQCRAEVASRLWVV